MNTKKRILSLDAFRGLCIVGMLLVDYVGEWSNNFSFLYHADWNGFNSPDVIFPAFLFIVGVAMTFSISKQVKKGYSHNTIIKKALKRTLVLIGLGLLSNAFLGSGNLFETMKTLRIMGVLQRIGIVYFICTILYLKLNLRKLAFVGAGILLGYWALITLIPVPGFGAPDINIHPRDQIANLSAWLDATLLGNHIADWNKPFDNEGPLSTIPAIVTCLIGLFIGTFIKEKRAENDKVRGLLIIGVVLTAVGYIWGIWYPINKLLWSSSFVLFSGGLSIMIFAVFYWIIDVLGYKAWSNPLQVFGKNAVLIFTSGLSIMGIFWRVSVNVGGEATPIRLAIYNNIFKPLSDTPQISSILYPIAVIIFWYMVSYFLDKKKIYLRA